MDKSLGVDWEVIAKPISYLEGLKLMDLHVGMIKNSNAKDKILLLEHQDVYTTGTQCSESKIDGIPVIKSNRGGGLTYHGPGQRVIYPVLNLANYKKDLHWYIDTLEKWIIESLRCLEVTAEQSTKGRGVWIKGKGKIASIGVRLHKWIAFHGCAVNMSSAMERFDRIKPCGMTEDKMISLKQLLGKDLPLKLLDQALIDTFEPCFNLS